MPSEIIQNAGHRNLYTEYFMIPTLRNFRQNMVVQAFDNEGNGFFDRYITINLNAKSHPDIIATCIITRGDYGQVEACIMASDTLTKLPKQEQKKYLAHEWIHAMMAFRQEKENAIQVKTLSNQAEAALYGYVLASNSFWQDDEQSLREIDEAVKHILVSDELVSQVLNKVFQTDIHQLCKYSNVQENLFNTIKLVSEFKEVFSSRYDVSPEIVTRRLIEMIFKDNEDTFLSLKKEFWLKL